MKVPKLRKNLCWREVEGEALLLDRENNRLHSFNATAACILSAIDGSRNASEIGWILAERFEVPSEVAIADTRSMISQLEKCGLLEESKTGEVKWRPCEYFPEV